MENSNVRVGFNSLLNAEADAVLRQPVFKRSPVLSKLLRYLVDATLDGRAEKLKSFVVATEGLGRSDKFDPASDSSARVQMVRLRKTLENHYAQYAPVDELCLYLQPGSYTVRLGKPGVAYPMLYRPLQDNKRDAAPAGFQKTSAAVGDRFDEPSAVSRSRWPHWARLGTIAAAIALASVATYLLSTQFSTQHNPVRLSPVLELMPVNAEDDPQDTEIAELVTAMFHDDLPRFKLARVRILDAPDRAPTPDQSDSVFRLYSRLQSTGKDQRDLYVQIREARTNTTIWSQKLPLPSDVTAARNAMAPLLAQINGPFGIITTHNIANSPDATRGGYPCMLRYIEFMAARTDALEQNLAACFEKPVREQYIRSSVLAARAMFTIERTAARANLTAARKEAMQYARAAVAADPNDGYATYAVARLSYGIGDCVSARFYTKRAVDANPNSPIIVGTLAALASECNYRDAAYLLDRAILLQNPHMGNNRLLLVLAALSQGRPDKLSEIGPTDLPTSKFYRQRYYLAETLIAASQGRRDAAARHWERFTHYSPPSAKTPEDKLHPIIALPDMQKRVTDYLRQSGVVLSNA